MGDGGLTLGLLLRIVVGIFVFTGIVMLAAWASWRMHERREVKRRAEHPDDPDPRWGDYSP